MHQRAQAIQAQFSELTSHAHENLSGVRVVRAYRQEGAEIAHFRGAERGVPADEPGPGPGAGTLLPPAAPLGGLSAVVVLYVGGKLVMAGQVTVGEFVAFGVYLGMLVWPMIALGWAVNLVQRGAASMARINQLFREQPAITEPGEPHRTCRPREAGGPWSSTASGSATPARTSVDGCSQDISFTVEPGRSLAIVGATGSGKSTLVDLIVRAYDPDRGACSRRTWMCGS